MKMGGTVQIGPLASVDWEKGVYGEVTLKGEEIASSGYLSTVSYFSPVLFAFRLYDERKRKTSSATPPTSLSGDIVSVNVSASALPSDLSFSSHSFDVEIECSKNESDYVSFFNRKMLFGKLSVIPIGKDVSTPLGVSIYGRLTMKVADYKETKMRFEGECIKKRLEEMQLGIPVYLEGFSHTDAIKKLGEMAGVNVVCDDDSSIVLESGKENKWVFPPGMKVWAAMRKIASLSGYLLYPDKNGNVVYKVVPSSPSFSFIRGESPISDIEYRSIDMWKTRIFVIGKAGKDTEEYFASDILSGAILHKSMENDIGFDLVYSEVDDGFSDWDLIEKKLNTLDNNFNKNNLFVSFTITDARDFLSLFLYDVFSWTDPFNPYFDGKNFIVSRVVFDIDAFKCTASVTGKMILFRNLNLRIIKVIRRKN